MNENKSLDWLIDDLRDKAFNYMDDQCKSIRYLFDHNQSNHAINAMSYAESVTNAFYQIGLIDEDEKHERNLLIQDEYLRSLGLNREWLNSEYEPSIDYEMGL